MPDHDEAVAAALDSYQYRLLPDHIHSHRADPTLAERLIDSFLQQLARYADRRDLDIHDTLAELHQQRIDRGGPDHAPEYSFRLGAQVQPRQPPTATGDNAGHPLWRGFITALAATPDGQAQCTVRIPGVNQALQITAAELEPADSLLPLPTRTAGIVITAAEAEQTIIDIAVRLKRAAGNGLATNEHALADLAQLTMRLSAWSGSQPDAIMRHLYDRITDAAHPPPQE
ncbi:hypothetical protein, partial [Actinomadura sp. 6K520]|uniref:hypothetical protein n=1 Tax=Actinomadura sp. 6K520 TaxID=2530364 RepID=UPI001047658D